MTSSCFGRIDRRRLIASSVIGAAAVLATGQPLLAGTRPGQPAPLLAQDGSPSVPMFRGNAAHTGEMPGPAPDASNDIAVRWQFATGGMVRSSPVVANGTVYVGSFDMNVYAIDLQTGNEQWRYATGGQVYETATVVGDTVFVGSGDKNLHALDAGSGEELWRFATSKENLSSPPVVEGIVYLESADAQGNNASLQAIDAKDGTELWSVAIENAPAVSPTIADGIIYFPNNSRIQALDAHSGSDRWLSAAMDRFISTVTVANGTVFAGGGAGKIYAIDADKGTTRWQFALDQEAELSLAVAGDMLYVGAFDGSVHCLDVQDGTEVWRYTLEGYFPSQAVHMGFAYPSVVGNVVLVGQTMFPNHHVFEIYAFDNQDGTELWRFKANDFVASALTVADGLILAGCDDGNVYALGAPSNASKNLTRR